MEELQPAKSASVAKPETNVKFCATVAVPESEIILKNGAFGYVIWLREGKRNIPLDRKCSLWDVQV